MIVKHVGIMKALSVIEIVNDLIGDRFSSSLQTFDNCREQGLCFDLGGSYIAIANQRHSDSIIVYQYREIAYPSNLPPNSDPGWNGTKFGRYDFLGAAEYVIRLIEEAIGGEVSGD